MDCIAVTINMTCTINFLNQTPHTHTLILGIQKKKKSMPNDTVAS